MAKYLVTGCGGFVGKHMIEYLDKKECEIIATDLFRPDYLDNHSDVKFLESNLADEKSLEKVVEKDIDAIFHIAAIFDFFASYELLHKVNVEGVGNLCRVALDKGTKKFINWSSGAIYGNKYGNMSAKEEFKPYPGDNYSLSKWQGEVEAFKYSKKGLDVLSIRPAAIYGPGSKYGDASALYLLKKGIFCVKPGFKKVMSSHIHVEDVVRSAYFLRNKGVKKHEIVSDIAFNVCDDKPTLNHQLIEEAAKAIPNKGLFGYLGIPVPGITLKLAAYAAETFARITKTKPIFEVDSVGLLLDGHSMDNNKIKQLGFQFDHPDLMESLEELIEWYEGNNWEVFKK